MYLSILPLFLIFLIPLMFSVSWGPILFTFAPCPFSSFSSYVKMDHHHLHRLHPKLVLSYQFRVFLVQGQFV
jgi:hypothetical protein